MAAENLSAISAALSQIFAEPLERQWNRTAMAATRIAARAGSGKNAAWDVAFTGATADTVADGADVTAGEFNSDKNEPAILPWAHYRSSFQISETELDAAASSVGIPTALQDLFAERIMGNGAKIAAKINADIYNATGVDGSTNPTIYGMVGGGGLAATGLYAGLSRVTYPEWKGNVRANGGTPRPLTIDLLDQMDADIFTASGVDFDELFISPGGYRKFKGLFTSVQRVVTDGSGAPRYDASTDSLFYKGKPVTRDKDCPAGTVIFKNNMAVEIKWLPRVMNPQDAAVARMGQVTASDGKNLVATGLPMRIAVLGKTGDNVKVSMKLVLQMLIKRPNTMGMIQDIDET